jgi:hypothetical protein
MLKIDLSVKEIDLILVLLENAASGYYSADQEYATLLTIPQEDMAADLFEQLQDVLLEETDDNEDE